MDVGRYQELAVAPRALFDRLAERRERPRFMVPAADGWRAVTTGDFADEIRRVALFLARDGGLEVGDRVAIFASNRVEWMTAALAAQSAGGVPVPIYPASTATQAAYVVAHAEARVLFVDGPALARVLARVEAYTPTVRAIVMIDPHADLGRVLAGASPEAAAAVERLLVPWSRVVARGEAHHADDPQAFTRMLDGVTLDQPGLMLYTSGTSGEPKGVPLTHRNVAVNGRDWLNSLHALVPDESDADGGVDLLWLPMSHIFGFGEACLGNTLGWTSWLVDPMSVLARLPEVRPNVFMSVPSVWEKLAMTAAAEADRGAALARLTGGRLRFCLSGGAGLKREVKEQFREAGLLILEGYGLTECSPTLTLNRPDAVRFDSVGKPLPSVELKLAEDGEIWARGASVFAGYHKDPAATREAFTEDGWFKTGDVGRFTEDGFLQIVDRKKDILVTAGGKNIPPANIELRFRDDPAIAHVLVYGDGHRYLVAGVWLAGDAARLPAEEARALVQRSIDRVNHSLPGYETIKKFVIFDRPLTVEDGFLTTTLKLRRKKIVEVFGARLEALYA